MQKHLETTVRFEPIAAKGNFPPPYHTLDSLLTEFYDWYYALPVVHDPDSMNTWVKYDMPDSMMKSFAKTILQSHSYPHNYWLKYFLTARTPRLKQFNRLDDAKKRESVWQEVPYVLPGYVVNIYFKNYQVEKRMPWIFTLLLQNWHILVVEPYKKTSRYLNPEVHFMKTTIYGVRVRDDMIGNYSEDDSISLIANYQKGSVRSMSIGSKYLVTLQTQDHKVEENPWVVRGVVTNGQGIFPVKSGIIQDPKNNLRFGTSISVIDFKDQVKQFLQREFNYDNN